MSRIPSSQDRPLSRPFDHLDRFGSQVAVLDEDGKMLTYEQLLMRADKIGAQLKGRCLVMIVCRNDPDCLAGYIGLSRAGAAIMLVHHSLPLEQRQSIIDAFQPHLVYAQDDTSSEYALTPTGHAADFPIHEDLCLLLTTSGSTGSRSFVRLSYDNVTSNALSIIDYLGITSIDRAIMTMPMSYTYGLSIIHSHLLAGASLITNEASLVSPVFWKALKELEATSFGGVPFIYEILLKLRFGRMDLPHLKTLTQAGGKLSDDVARKMIDICKDKGMRFVTMYGQTEATARMSYLAWEKAEEKAGSIGTAIPGGNLWLADDQGHPVQAPEIPGELVYEGPNVSLGYAESWKDLSRGDDNQGQLFTGDIASRDVDGYFTIVGRKKRFLKIVGHRINLDETEQILKKAGHDCACGGVDNMLSVFIPAGTDPAAVKSLLIEQISLNPNSFRIVEIDQIPRLDSGKTDYQALQKLIADQ
tara:strand:- start:11 stop:1429 length:1419 start_codon:yes stop_codon:yes gene_type:complete